MPASFLLPLFAMAAAADRPINVVGHAWAPFISPMGEPFRARSATDDTLARWFGQADRNHDGQLTPEEMVADADRFFATVDSDGDGEITPEELIHYEWELAPDIQVNSRLQRYPGDPAAPQGSGESRRRRAETDPLTAAGGLQGAARYGLLNMPEPVAAADADLDRAISRAEFDQAARERFKLLDRDRKGVLTLAGLETMWSEVLARVKQKKRKPEEVDSRVGVPVPLDP